MESMDVSKSRKSTMKFAVIFVFLIQFILSISLAFAGPHRSRGGYILNHPSIIKFDGGANDVTLGLAGTPSNPDVNYLLDNTKATGDYTLATTDDITAVGPGTTDRLAKWTGANALGDSQFDEGLTNVTLTGRNLDIGGAGPCAQDITVEYHRSPAAFCVFTRHRATTWELWVGGPRQILVDAAGTTYTMPLNVADDLTLITGNELVFDALIGADLDIRIGINADPCDGSVDKYGSKHLFPPEFICGYIAGWGTEIAENLSVDNCAISCATALGSCTTYEVTIAGCGGTNSHTVFSVAGELSRTLTQCFLEDNQTIFKTNCSPPTLCHAGGLVVTPVWPIDGNLIIAGTDGCYSRNFPTNIGRDGQDITIQMTSSCCFVTTVEGHSLLDCGTDVMTVQYDGADYFTQMPPISAIALNTAKVSNVTHTGHVTGSGILTISDNAVSLAKLQHETAGWLFTFGACGVPVFTSTGTAGQLLTSNGAGSAPSMEDIDSVPGDLTVEDAGTFNNTYADNDFIVNANTETGSVASVADAGGGDITLTDVAHGLFQGDSVVHTAFSDSNYNGTFTVNSVPTDDTYDVTATFTATGTGTWTATVPAYTYDAGTRMHKIRGELTAVGGVVGVDGNLNLTNTSANVAFTMNNGTGIGFSFRRNQTGGLDANTVFDQHGDGKFNFNHNGSGVNAFFDFKWPSGDGSSLLIEEDQVTIAADLFAPDMKTGTTQGGAGAAAGELWADSDDDFTVKLGQ